MKTHVFILVIVLLGLFFIGCISQPQVSPEKFLSNFMNADKVSIVVDVTDAPNMKIKHNCMQCAVDYISSSGPLLKAGKLSYYVIEGNACYPTDFSKNESEWSTEPIEREQCVKEYSQHPYLLIIPGNGKPEFYSDHAVIYVGEDYQLDQCKFDFVTTTNT